MNKRRIFVGGVIVASTLVGAGVAVASGGWDVGLLRDAGLRIASQDLFGVRRPLVESSTLAVDKATATADPRKLVTLAGGLKARVVSSTAGTRADQMALWPDGDNPKYLIACNEESPARAGVQRINIATGVAETIVTGTNSCDGVRRTAWGTILFSEENGTTGQSYELIDPLGTTGVTLDRTTGVFSGGTGTGNLVRREALGRMSFEGHGLLPSGVMYYGDENRPGTGTPGGAYFKFVPTAPFAGGAAITSLSASPLASGTIYGLQLGLRSPADSGQGTQTGQGKWLQVCSDGSATPCANVDLRAATTSLKLNGYYRPEDLEVDPWALAAGNVKVCGNNTGNEFLDHNWGETVCITDGSVATSLAGTAVPEVQFFVVNSSDMAMTDNIAPQFSSNGRWLIVEDGDVGNGEETKNNDMFLCLPDGADADSLSDGCVKVASLNDRGTAIHPEGAEWTGPIFTNDGKHLFVSVQHNITSMTDPVSTSDNPDHGVILEITGWGV
jgi:secreted PhoX family phosphatase